MEYMAIKCIVQIATPLFNDSNSNYGNNVNDDVICFVVGSDMMIYI